MGYKEHDNNNEIFILFITSSRIHHPVKKDKRSNVAVAKNVEKY